MFFIIDPFFITVFAAIAVLYLLFLILRSLRMPENFADNQLQRNEIRKQIIRNKIILSEGMEREEATQVS